MAKKTGKRAQRPVETAVRKGSEGLFQQAGELAMESGGMAAMRDNLLLTLESKLSDVNHAAVMQVEQGGPPRFDQGLQQQLTKAAKRGNPDAVLKCLGKNALIDFQDCYGNAALHYAAQNNHPECVCMLMECGADPLLRNKHGCVPLVLACAGERPSQLDTVAELLSVAPVTADGQQHGGAVPGARARGVRTERGSTALHTVANNGNILALNLLLRGQVSDVGCGKRFIPPLKPNVINLPNHGGQTALIVAATAGQPDCVELLLKCGANPTVQDLCSQTAEEAARRAGFTDCVARVRQHSTQAAMAAADRLGSDAHIADIAEKKRRQAIYMARLRQADPQHGSLRGLPNPYRPPPKSLAQPFKAPYSCMAAMDHFVEEGHRLVEHETMPVRHVHHCDNPVICTVGFSALGKLRRERLAKDKALRMGGLG